MALTSDALEFRYGVASGYLDSQSDPDQSLGGYVSKTLYGIQSAVTSAGSTSLFTDSAQIDDKPASPDPRTPLVDSDDYVSSGDLVHWYRPAYGDPATDMGLDYATAGTPRNLNTVLNLDASDISSEQPGQFDQQRYSVDFDGASDETIKQNSAVTFGIANAWSISVWVRPDTIGVFYSRCVRLGASANSEGTNEISIMRYSNSLQVRIADATVAADRKDHLFAGFFVVDTWVHIVVTWNGSSLLVYKNGSLVSPDVVLENDSVTQTDAAKYMLISGLRATFADPQEEWEGQIHSVCIWDSVLTAAEIADLVDFGDGVGDPVLDHTGKWMVFLTGSNAMDSRKIIYHDNTTGVMGFAPVWGTAPSVSDIFRIAGPNDLFDIITASQCAEGGVDYRHLRMWNNTGVLVSDVRLYLVQLEGEGFELEIAAGNLGKGANPIASIATDEDEPDIRDNSGIDAFTSTIPQSWRKPDDYESARETPWSSSGFSFNIGQNFGIWLKRTSPVLHKRIDGAAWLLVMEETGGTKTAVPIVFDAAGFNPTFTLEIDRKPRTFGGAHVTTRVVDDQIGQPVPDESVTIAITTGPGILNTDTQPLDTDVNGEAGGVYISPEDDAQAGNSVTITATLGGDP